MFESLNGYALTAANTIRQQSKAGAIVSAGLVRHRGRLKVLLEFNRWDDQIAAKVADSHRKNGSATQMNFSDSSWIERLR